MAKKLDAILVVDLESTCWQGAPPSDQQSDIIEVGLTVLDLKTLERTDKQSFLVKPQRSSVSEFCTELTTITPEMLTDAPSLEEVCATLRRDYKSRERPWASYGDYDRRQFERCCRDLGIGYPFGPSHLNVKTLFAMSYGLSRETGMARALEMSKRPLEGTHHRGGDDAWNIAAILSDLLGSARGAL